MICPHCNASLLDGARFCNTCGQATSGTAPLSSTDMGTSAPLVGREIAGRYRLLALLGEGGMGSVYRAEQISLKRTVAVKLLRPDVSSNPLILRRFDAEATAVGKLSHPNTVNIYDFGRDSDGSLFIAMEYIDGRSLRSVVASESPLGIGRTLAIAAQVAASLSDAHGHAIIHRDLKPDNVMLQDRGRDKDVVRVLDFGIAKLRDETHQTQAALTAAGDVLGTPQYMAPEQIRGEHVDGRTDVYALGCMMYEMVTGRLPFEAPTIMAIMSKHLLETCPPPSVRRPDLGLPASIDQLVMTAMAKDANVRWPTMEAFGEHIANTLAQLPPEQRNKSAKLSAAVASPVMTPPAYSVMAGGQTQPSPTPLHAIPHTPPPAQPQHGQQPALYPAYPPAPTPPPHFVQASYLGPPRAKNRLMLWIVVSVLGTVSLGLIVWGLRPAQHDKDNHGSGSSGSGDPFSEDNHHHEQPDDPSPQPEPQPEPPEPQSDPKPQPPQPQPPSEASFGQSPLPDGAHLVVPEGWRELAPVSSKGHMIQNVQVPMAMIIMSAVPASITREALIGMATKAGSKFQSQTQVMSAGARRDALVFLGKANGHDVGEVMVIYPHNIVVIAQIPQELLSQPGFNEAAQEFWAKNVVVP